MSSIDNAQTRPLSDLLSGIVRHDTRLPIFQRDYVWRVANVKKLLGSIGSGFPIGSILRLQIKEGRTPFPYRLFNPYSEQPSEVNKNFNYMILDGQQRLTSLLHVLYGLGENRYYLDFKKLYQQYENNPDEISFEECIEVVKHNRVSTEKYDQNSELSARWLMPFKYLSEGGYYNWKGQISPDIPNAYNEIFNNLCNQIINYEIPVVTLKADISIEAICTIFESLNNNGKQLTPFELVNARIYGQSDTEIDLATNIREAHKEDANIDSTEFSDYAILQIIALLITYNSHIAFLNAGGTKEKAPAVSCKKKDVLDKITLEQIKKYWDKVIEASKYTFKLLKESCGLLDISYLPYRSIMIPLVATITVLELPKKNGPAVGAIKANIVQWYWNAIFSQKYETSTDTRGASDFVELVNWIGNGGAKPNVMNSSNILQLNLREHSNTNSGIYNGILCLLIQNNPLDFYTGSTLRNLQGIDDHHIFPLNFLGRNPSLVNAQNDSEKVKLKNCILNRSLISSTTNRKIQDKKPSEYMIEIKQTHITNSQNSADSFKQILKSHLLPHGNDECFMQDNFELFLDLRQQIIMAEIKRVTGL